MSITALEEPEVVDIVVHRGNSFNRVLEIENEDGTPAQLSSYDAVGQIIDNETGELLATFVIPQLQDDGIISLTVKKSDIDALDVGSVCWSLTLIHKTKPDLETITIIVGEVSIRKATYVTS